MVKTRNALWTAAEARPGTVTNLIVGLLVEPEGLDLKPQLVLFNPWEEPRAGVCQVGVCQTSEGNVGH